MKKDANQLRLWNAIKPLQTTVSFLNTGAHPDDERSDLLSFLSRGLGVQTAAIIANRGEGGQNAIGDETGNALGVLRTNEMKKAAEVLGIDVIHLSEITDDAIYDYGIEKTAEDTLRKWGEKTTYERFIRQIRTYRPDIVMPCFLDNDTEHGHHRAITALTVKAFHDANDPSVFPEQLNEGLSTWQIKKLYFPVDNLNDATIQFEIGEVDPMYGLTYPQIGEKSRYLHRTQGMGEDLKQESRIYGLELIYSDVNNLSTDKELFTSIPANFRQFASQLEVDSKLRHQLEQLQNQLEQMIAVFPNDDQIFSLAEDALVHVHALIKAVPSLAIEPALQDELLHKLQIKRNQLYQVSFLTANIHIDTAIDSTIVTRGSTTNIQLHITNNNNKSIDVKKIDLSVPHNWTIRVDDADVHTLLPAETKTFNFEVTVPNDASFTHPYVKDEIQVQIQFETLLTTFTHIESLNEITVLPDVSINLKQEHVALNTRCTQNKIKLNATIKSYKNAALTAQVHVNIPADWTIIQTETSVTLEKQFAEKELQFTIIPPKQLQDGVVDIEVTATVLGQTFSSSVQEIEYSHIDRAYYIYPAMLRTTAFDLAVPKTLKIGYIESGFDKVADALIATNFNITKLTEMDLAVRDLSIYDTIVIGIRAYLSRADLCKYHNRIMQYVRNGGHVVVQYHKPTDGIDGEIPSPYPFKLGTPSIRWRVADEAAKVRITNQRSEILSYPNMIHNEDWDNWVQERGLYFPMEWSNQFETILQIADENETPMDSGILVADYGKGTYVYTNLVFYRQIQSQIPGGYRLFTNLLSFGQTKQKKASRKPLLLDHLQIS